MLHECPTRGRMLESPVLQCHCPSAVSVFPTCSRPVAALVNNIVKKHHTVIRQVMLCRQKKTATCTWPPPVNMSSRRAPNSQRIRHSAWVCSARCTACRRMARRLILQARHGTTHTSKPEKRAKTQPSHPRPEKERFPGKTSAESVQSPSIVFTSADVFRAPERHTGPFGPFSRAQNRASPERHADGRAPQKGTRQCSGVRRFLPEK